MSANCVAGDVAGDDYEDTADRVRAGDAGCRDAGLRVAVEVSNLPFDQAQRCPILGGQVFGA
jgi:hypothetical protein